MTTNLELKIMGIAAGINFAVLMVVPSYPVVIGYFITCAVLAVIYGMKLRLESEHKVNEETAKATAEEIAQLKSEISNIKMSMGSRR